MALLTYDPKNVLLPHTGLACEDLSELGPWLERARQEVEGDIKLWRKYADEPSRIPDEKKPLDTEFIDLPKALLDEHKASGEQSELGRIVKAADRLSELVDRVVVLGIGGSYMGARALLEACCNPFRNELGRQQRVRRGLSRPRMYFEGNNVEEPHMAAVRDLLGSDPKGWGIVVVSKSGGTLETAVALRLLLRWLGEAWNNDGAKVAERVVAVTGAKGLLRDLVGALKCADVFTHPEAVGGRFSVLSSGGLLCAAVMGLDVTALLKGAVDMNEHFRKAPVGQNAVLDYAGVCYLMETLRGATIRVLSTWGKRLEAVGLWYDQLLAESLGKHGFGATPLTVVNTRDLHSRGQQHQEGRRDKLITNLFVETGAARKAIKVGTSDRNEDQLDVLAGKTLPEILEAARLGTNQAYRDDRRPTADLRLPAIDEHSLGQLFQMLMLATVVEGRLIGINPYGQPGVEAYKRNMNRILGR
jgi:glucose-6-phosphate isomerase